MAAVEDVTEYTEYSPRVVAATSAMPVAKARAALRTSIKLRVGEAHQHPMRIAEPMSRWRIDELESSSVHAATTKTMTQNTPSVITKEERSECLIVLPVGETNGR